MKGLFWILALLALAVSISLAFDINEGYILLILPPYETRISFNLAIVLLLFGPLLIYSLVRSLALALSVPRRIRAFRLRRAREKSQKALEESICLLFEGDFDKAVKRAALAHQKGSKGHFGAVSALLAACAAQRLGDAEQQKKWQEQAEQDDPRTQSASLMLSAGTSIEAGHFDEAIEFLGRLPESVATHVATLRMELRARQGKGQWNEVLRVTRLLEKQKAMVENEAQGIKCQAHNENIALQAATLEQLQNYFKSIPNSELSPQFDGHVARRMLDLGAGEEAAKFIVKRLAKSWDLSLVELYGQIREGDAVARIERVDGWLAQHPDEPRLLLTLGRMCLEQRLWGKAQTYLDAALSVAVMAEDKRRIHLELARFCEETERDDDAAVHYRATAIANDKESCPSLPVEEEVPALVDKG